MHLPEFDALASHVSVDTCSFPSVQELSLTLSADIEIHRLWKSTTEILSQNFYATRIALCLPQDATVPSSEIESSVHSSRPWGLKAHWDSKSHFLDENTVTPRDEFVHHHHRLNKASSTGSEGNRPVTLRSSGSISSLSFPVSSSSSVSSSASSSSFSRRREGRSSTNRLSISLNSGRVYYGHDNNTTTNNTSKDNKDNSKKSNNNNSNDISSKAGYTIAGEGGMMTDDMTESKGEDVEEVEEEEYNKDYWKTSGPHDGGYSSSTSSISSYSSRGSSAPIRRGGPGQTRGFGVHPRGTECFAHLQSLEYDPEPLLNEQTIDSILRAGKTVVLTREYTNPNTSLARGNRVRGSDYGPGRNRDGMEDEDEGDYDDATYTDTDVADDDVEGGQVNVNDNLDESRHHLDQDENSDIESSSSRSSEGSYFPPVESSLAYGLISQASPGFADFVQGLNPTWSQSPAPSPNIIKEDPTINPFFFQPLASYPTMDDDAFDPPDQTFESAEEGHSSASEIQKTPRARRRSSGTPYTAQPNISAAQQQKASSALENARSLIHIPLYRSTDHFNNRHLPSDIRRNRAPMMPVGILSFLSDQLPYPPKALDILTELSPFLANQITSALRLEDMVARSQRWGEPDVSLLSDGLRASTNETFAESIQRKMKDNQSIRTPKTFAPSTSNARHQHAHFDSQRGGSQIQPDTMARVGRMPTGVAGSTNDIADDLSAIQGTQGQTSTRSVAIGVGSLDSHQSKKDVDSAFRSKRDPFQTEQSPDSQRLSKSLDSVSRAKEPESYYNLDSTTDEIHRSLNLLNLDITGSATCPLAPQTKKMLGRSHSGSKNGHSHPIHIDDTLLDPWPNERQRAETTPALYDVDGPDAMWQTISPEEEPETVLSNSNRTAVEGDTVPSDVTTAAGHESPYYGSIHSASPSVAPKRHLFSTNKRSGVRRRRKSVKEHSKSVSQPHVSESPMPSSPYTSTVPDFPSQFLEPVAMSAPVAFSPEPSPFVSPTVPSTRVFEHGFKIKGESTSPDTGSTAKPSHVEPNRVTGETSAKVDRVPLSRHGSGWSLNSDDTNLTSPNLHERHHTGRRHKKRHQAFSSERHGHNPFPRTRLLRLIVDAIAHHVFTLSPQTGCMTWLNQRALQYTGTPLSQLLHTPWTRMLHDDDRDALKPRFKECFDRGEMFNAQYRVRRFDGQYRWFLGRILPVRDCGGNIVHWFATSTDIHDQKLAELQLNRQVELEVNEKKYRLLAEAIPQIVFTAAPHIGLTFANAKWYTYSGQVFEQACGLGFMDHVHPDDRAKCFLPTNISEGPGSPPMIPDTEPTYKQSTTPGSSTGQNPGEVSYQTELRLKRKDGKFRWFLVKCISVEVVEQGRKWFGTCTDINDHKLLEQKLKEAHDAAQKSTESKTRFLSNMSHEIRTPLVGITGMVNFLITTDLTSEQLDYVHTVQQSADALLLVINDILDLSKVEAGMMKLEMEPFSVHAMIEGANELLSTLAIQKGLELGFLVENEVPEVVVGDRVRLRQVLINIIGNAIKFTTHGEVFTRCSVVPVSPGGDQNGLIIKFEVSDTGKGFDEAERALMFKPFSQVDTSSTRKHGGTGLGLVLSKEFVELHGGEISCESVKGKGSTFSFTFKARLPSSNTMATALTPGDEIRVAGLVQNQAKGQHLQKQEQQQVTTTSIEPKYPERPALRHVTGLKLAPGEMCLPSQDYEETKDIALQALKNATTALGKGERSAEADMEEDQATRLVSESSVDSMSPPRELSTAMTRTEAILDDRRYLKVGQLTPSNPPMGEPPGVAVIAANLPNPALDMRLAIPAKVLESKALAAENKKAARLEQANNIKSNNNNKSDSTNGHDSASASSTLVNTLSETKSLTPSSIPLTSSPPSTSSIHPPSSSGSSSVDASYEARPFQARILVVADLLHARDTIVHLVKQLVPSDMELLMDVATDLREGIEYLVGGRKSTCTTGYYNYVIMNLANYMAVMDLFSVLQKDGVRIDSNVMTCVITTPIQRTSLMEAVKVEEASQEVSKTLNASVKKVIPSRVEWVFKPLTKSKLYVAFADIISRQEHFRRNDSGTGDSDSGSHGVGGKDPSGKAGQQGANSNNKNDAMKQTGGDSGKGVSASGAGAKVTLKRQTAQQVVMNQKEVFSQMKEDMKGKNFRILMAEDDLINQKVIRRYFQFVGAELVIANDGNECLEKFKSHPQGYFSLILLPGRDGYATTRAVREWEDQYLPPDAKRIPIVALSANVMANVTEQCLSCGFTSYLSKPVDFKRLSETLRELLID
ncbi:hypothetical protein BGZ94_001067 [Podila epigama]|nr:hypothetical protein BGZ94_001067 [Podila epigama]